jgi:hypothetical protein
LSLDDLNSQPWPKEAVRALDAWQQGDVVEVGKRLMWIGVGGKDALTGVTSDADGDRVLASDDGGTTGYAVITTQTCDVIGAPPGSKQPWVQVSPICAVTDSSQLNNIRKGWLLNHVLVTADIGLSGTNAVDLRHSFPISKAVLLQQVRRSAFTNEADVLRLAERLAVKAGRASHHDLIGGSLAQALKAVVAAEIEAGTWQSPIEQFRVVITEGTRLQPRRVRLLVITKVTATSALTKAINTCVKAWKKRERKPLADAQIDVEEVEFRAIRDIDVPDYRAAVHLPVEEVTRTYWF